MATPSNTDTDGESNANATRNARQPGPILLNERPLLAIFVHLIAMLTGFLGVGFVVAGLVYRFSNHEYTRANARNALNWQLFYTAFTAGLFVFAGLTVVVGNAVPLPDVVMLVPILIVVVWIVLSLPLLLLNIAFAFVATGKAIFGQAWSYPIAPGFV